MTPCLEKAWACRMSSCIYTHAPGGAHARTLMICFMRLQHGGLRQKRCSDKYWGYFRSIPIKIDTREETKIWKAAFWLRLYENYCTAIWITTLVIRDKFNKHEHHLHALHD
jgi:hypothetical protein